MIHKDARERTLHKKLLQQIKFIHIKIRTSLNAFLPLSIKYFLVLFSCIFWIIISELSLTQCHSVINSIP